MPNDITVRMPGAVDVPDEVPALAKAWEDTVAQGHAMLRALLGHWEDLGIAIRAREHQLANLDEQAEDLLMAIAHHGAQAEELQQAHDAQLQAYEEEHDQLQAWGQQQRATLGAEVQALIVTKARLEVETKRLREACETLRAHGGS